MKFKNIYSKAKMRRMSFFFFLYFFLFQFNVAQFVFQLIGCLTSFLYIVSLSSVDENSHVDIFFRKFNAFIEKTKQAYTFLVCEKNTYYFQEFAVKIRSENRLDKSQVYI